MLNNTSLTGRIANDLELKHTQSGVAVLSFRIAVDRKYKNAQGERETDFINCVAWRQTAETMAQYLGKGSLIGIEGSIQTRDYQHNQGYTVYVTEVLVDNFAFLETKAENQANRNQSNQNVNYNQSTSSSSFDNNPFEDNVDDFGIDDSDLPF